MALLWGSGFWARRSSFGAVYYSPLPAFSLDLELMPLVTCRIFHLQSTGATFLARDQFVSQLLR